MTWPLAGVLSLPSWQVSSACAAVVGATNHLGNPSPAQPRGSPDTLSNLKSQRWGLLLSNPFPLIFQDQEREHVPQDLPRGGHWQARRAHFVGTTHLEILKLLSEEQEAHSRNVWWELKTKTDKQSPSTLGSSLRTRVLTAAFSSSSVFHVQINYFF